MKDIKSGVTIKKGKSASTILRYTLKYRKP